MMAQISTGCETPIRQNVLLKSQLPFATTKNDTQVCGWLVKTAQTTGMLTRNKFMKRFYQLDLENHVLSVYEVADVKNECKLKQTIDLAGRITKVDDTLQKTLRPGYEKELKEKVEFDRIYNYPFALIYGTK